MQFKHTLLLLTLCLPTAFCGKKKAAQHDTAYVPTQQTAPADALFLSVPASASGVDFNNSFVEDHVTNIVNDPYLYNGGGVGILDVNRDGLQDLFFVSSLGACKLYLNEGGFKFKDITASAGVAADKGHKTGVTICDVNADGWSDIYICRTDRQPSENSRNLLFLNNQNGTFTERGRELGLADNSASNHAIFFDCDNDGDLDCYVVNHPVDFSGVHSVRAQDAGNGQYTRNTLPDKDYESDRFFKNEGGKFVDVTKQAGVYNRAFGLSATAADLNGDGFQDLIIGNDYLEPDFVYINNPAQPGNFTDQYKRYFRHTSYHTMGADMADINNDGLPDFVALDMLAEPPARRKELMTTMQTDRVATLTKYDYGNQLMRNVLQLNNGNGTFSDIACLSGVFETDWSWAPLIQDFDNDGWRDLFVANGFYRDVTNLDYVNFTIDSVNRHGGITTKSFPNMNDYLQLIPSTPIQNYCYRNKGDLSFENVSTRWGLTELTFSNGAAYADLDNDGDMDLVVSNLNAPAGLYKNRTNDVPTHPNWLQIKCLGVAPNTMAVGTKARITVGDQIQYAELTPTRGYFSSVEPLFHFGLGAAATIDKVEVEFPGQKLITLQNVPANQRLMLKMAEAQPGKLSPLPSPTPLMREVQAPNFVHQEDAIEDFNIERLLPWRMSTPGPCMAVGDVNRDGLDDVYIGNAAGAAGGLFLQKGGGFQSVAANVWEADKAYEDTGAAFFDADGDGDLDLCVASGGNSFPASSPNYQPRLYLGDGRGGFSKSNGLPGDLNRSLYAVSAHDYDADGDLDLFLGGWCIPGSYPATPPSFILQNDGKGNFKNVTSQVSAAFGNAGLVRALVWADLDGDKKEELVVAGEWMPIHAYAVNGAQLTDVSAKFGLEGTNGIWRSLAAADVDGDGDQDLIAGNLGLNTRYHAAADAPMRIFAKDFDANGSTDAIMTLTENGQDNPVATREVFIKQLPGQRKKFVRSVTYARANLRDIYTDKDLETALKLQCNTLASTVFLNDNGHFSAHPLPNEAQIAPTQAIQVFDFQNDGDMDILLVGNDYGQQVETGRIDSGNGLLLQNDGKGNFKPIAPRVSGFWATKEAREVKMLRGAGGKRIILVGNNNDKPQAFSF